VSDEEWKKRLERAVEVSTYWFEKFHAANERIKRLEEAFTELEQCNLTDENCANMDVATRRIRNFARRAKEAKP